MKFGVFFLIFFLILKSISIFNLKQIVVNETEKRLILKTFNNANVKDSVGIIKLQNEVIDKIFHKYIGNDEISVDKMIFTKSGLCYDRSLLLQKIFLMNGYDVRPIFIFFNPNSTTKWYDFFLVKIESHSIFEIRYKKRWFVIRTNTKMKDFETIDQYLSNNHKIKNAKYIRFLNNRNGRFLAPKYIPDIYGF